jgi:hypothetical protein
VETTEAFVFLNASVDGLGRGWYALETVAGRNNQSVFHAVSPLLASRGGLRKRALELVAAVTGIALQRFDALTRDDRNHQDCCY